MRRSTPPLWPRSNGTPGVSAGAISAKISLRRRLPSDLRSMACAPQSAGGGRTRVPVPPSCHKGGRSNTGPLRWGASIPGPGPRRPRWTGFAAASAPNVNSLPWSHPAAAAPAPAGQPTCACPAPAGTTTPAPARTDAPARVAPAGAMPASESGATKTTAALRAGRVRSGSVRRSAPRNAGCSLACRANPARSASGFAGRLRRRTN